MIDERTVKISSAMSEGLVRLDGLNLPGHPITTFGTSVAALLEFAESPQGQEMHAKGRAFAQGLAAAAVRRRQEANAGVLVRLFGKSEAQERADVQARENAALAGGLLADVLAWGTKKLLAKRAMKHEAATSRQVIWHLLRYAAKDRSGEIPLHLDFQLLAVPQRLGASREEFLRLATLPIPDNHRTLERMTPDYALPLRMEVGRLVALFVRMNEDAPGALRERELDSFMTALLSLDASQVSWIQRQVRAEYSATVTDLSNLVGATVQCFVDSAAVIRTQGLVLHLDEIRDVAERVGAFDPLRAERERRRQMAVAALKVAGPLLAKHATRELTADLAPHLRTAAANSAHKVTKAMLDAGTSKGNRALIMELERRSQDGSTNRPTRLMGQLERIPAHERAPAPRSPAPSTTSQGSWESPPPRQSVASHGLELTWLDEGCEEVAEPLTRELFIGRSPDCDLAIDDDLVSRRHAQIFIRDGGLWLQDLGSSNGTGLNGETLEPHRAHRLRAGDEITIGQCSFMVKRPEPR